MTRDGHINAAGARQPLVRASVVTGLVVVCSLLLSIVTGGGPAQAQATTVTLNPDPATVNGCATIQVEIWINDVVDLYGADVRLTFDPAVVQVVDALPGLTGIQVEPVTTWLDEGWVVRNEADNVAGTIWYAMTQLNPSVPKSGSGPLARIYLQAVAEGTVTLHFTYTRLAELDGTVLPATPVDGSVVTVPLAGPSLSIARLNATDARLSWVAVPGASEYHLYRGTEPYFAPAAPPLYSGTALQYDDLGALGDVVTNYFYVLRTACANGFESANSTRMGEFDFALVRDRSNAVGLPLIDSTLVRADDLGAATGATVVSRWVEGSQRFDRRIVGLIGINFTLATAEGYLLDTPGSGPTVFTTAGAVPDPGAISFAISRGAVGSCRVNLLTLPLDHPSLTTADQLAADIGGVPVISRWAASVNRFDRRIVGLIGINFATRIGYPYWPCADLSGGGPTWP